MPYRSQAQRRFFHSSGAKRAGISPSVVKEFDRASKGKKLPEKKKKLQAMYGPRGVYVDNSTGSLANGPLVKLYRTAAKDVQNYEKNLRANMQKSKQGNKGFNLGVFPNPFNAKSYQKKRAAFGVDNKLKGSYGETTLQKGKPSIVKINVKKHKGNKKELADTIKHELMHVKHPKMHEKTVYKKMEKPIGPAEQAKLVSKLRMRKLNYKVGAVKRKLKMGRVSTKPGELISRAKSMGRGERDTLMGSV